MVGAVIYVRVSTTEQIDNLSLPTQLKTCEEYCERPGFTVRLRDCAASTRQPSLVVRSLGLPSRSSLKGERRLVDLTGGS